MRKGRNEGGMEGRAEGVDRQTKRQMDEWVGRNVLLQI
jgi:hypothetical protein